MKDAIVLTLGLLAPLVAGSQPPPPASVPPANRAAVEMQQMQDRMREIRNRMDRIRATDDPAKRARLMDEHLAGLERSVRDMQQLARQAPARVPCPRDDTQCQLAQLKAEQQEMQQRMEMIQAMMEQVLEQLEERDEERDKEHD